MVHAPSLPHTSHTGKESYLSTVYVTQSGLLEDLSPSSVTRPSKRLRSCDRTLYISRWEEEFPRRQGCTADEWYRAELRKDRRVLATGLVQVLQTKRLFFAYRPSPRQSCVVRFPILVPFVVVAAVWAVPIASRLRTWSRGRCGACVRCGYDLTGNTSGRCPECGADKSQFEKE